MRKGNYKSGMSLKFKMLKINSMRKLECYKLNFKEWPIEVSFPILNGFKKLNKFKNNINKLFKKLILKTLIN